MNINKLLPDYIREKISQEKILYLVPYDINKKGNYINEWIILIDNNIIKTQKDNLIYYNIKNGINYKVEGYYGQGILGYEENGIKKIVCRFSMGYLKRFTYMVNSINELKENGSIDINLTNENNNICANCNKIIPEDFKICIDCKNKSVILKKIFPLYKKYWMKIIIIVSIFLIISGLNIIQPIIYGKLTNSFLKSQNNDLRGFLIIILGLFLISISINLSALIRNIVTEAFGADFKDDLRSLVYSKIQNQGFDYISKRKTGDLFNRISRDTMKISKLLVSYMPNTLNQIITIVFVFIIMFLFNWKMAIILTFPLPIVIIFINRTRFYIRRLFRKQYRQSDKINSILQDILSGIRVVKAFGQEKNVIKTFGKENKIYKEMAIKNESDFNVIFPLMYFIINIGMIPIYYLGGKLVLSDSIKLGDLVMISQYAVIIYSNFNFIVFLPKMITEAMVAIERIFDILDREIKINEIEKPINLDIEGDILFENVTFGYQSHIPVLKNINLNIRKGQIVGLVGLSGAGKSTIINLLMRLYDVDEGRILIDGVDIRNLSKTNYSNQLGIVLQETFLFSGTILENVKYARPEASLEEIIISCKIANAHNFILNFTDGYDTKVGERGQRLSGGEKQRISIARAIISNPKILILDEATSSLDTHAEQDVQEALERLVLGRTTFMIAHRLATLRKADKLIVIKEGEIAEEGSHEELIDKKGIYYGFVEEQNLLRDIQKINSHSRE
ncbi:MAG: ABC transporter ATP-binding protein [Clostridiales bacterium]